MELLLSNYYPFIYIGLVFVLTILNLFYPCIPFNFHQHYPPQTNRCLNFYYSCFLLFTLSFSPIYKFLSSCYARSINNSIWILRTIRILNVTKKYLYFFSYYKSPDYLFGGITTAYRKPLPLMYKFY